MYVQVEKFQDCSGTSLEMFWDYLVWFREVPRLVYCAYNRLEVLCPDHVPESHKEDKESAGGTYESPNPKWTRLRYMKKYTRHEKAARVVCTIHSSPNASCGILRSRYGMWEEYSSPRSVIVPNWHTLVSFVFFFCWDSKGCTAMTACLQMLWTWNMVVPSLAHISQRSCSIFRTVRGTTVDWEGEKYHSLVLC